MLKFQVVIFHSGRVQRLQECLERVAPLRSKAGVKIRVSDNSGIASSKDVVAKFDGVETVIRTRCPFPVHFNLNRQEASGDVTVFLHDDDWLHPSYFDAVAAALSDPAVAAVSTNALVVGPTPGGADQLFAPLGTDVRTSTPDELFTAYFGDRPSACPFSLYAYRSTVLGRVQYSDEAAGKYSDVYFLAELLRIGQIHWCHGAHGSVGNFGDNDSHSESPNDRLRQFNALELYTLAPATLRSARRHIAKKLFLKAAADIVHRRRHGVRWRRYWSVAARCL